MANRDKTQGFAFAYIDIAKFLKEQKKYHKKGRAPVPPQGSNVINFNKDPQPRTNKLTPPPVKKLVETKQASEKEEKTKTVKQVRENLDRLQALHHKLHAMLDEMNKIAEWNKNKKK